VNNCPGKACAAMVDSTGTVVGLSDKHENALANPLSLYKTSYSFMLFLFK
jgi:hypothetical protein